MDRKKRALTAFSATLICLIPTAVLAGISVGVKNGDWVEYQVAYVGTPSEGHDVVWARMEIQNVQGATITAEFTAKYSDGKQDATTTTINLETGQLGDDFVIPAGLENGDTFFDENRGNITITRTEEKYVAGAERTVVYATTPQTTSYWDKTTGVIVECHASYPDFNMTSKADKTNMWQPQTLSLGSLAIYILPIAASLILVAAIALFVMRRRSKRK